MTGDVAVAKPSTMKYAHREMATASMVKMAIAIGFSLAVFVAVLGPMDTRQTLTLIQRFSYFGVVAFFVVPMCFGSILCTLYAMRNRRSVHLTLAMTVTGLIVIAPCTAVSVTAYALFHGGRFPGEPLLAIYVVGLLMFAGATSLVWYVLYLRLKLTMLDHSQAAIAGVPVRGTSGSDAKGAARHDVPLGSAPAEDAAISVALDAPDDSRRREQDEDDARIARPRLPAEIGEDVVYVHVSGHYVEVVTTSRTNVVLMRLSDVAEALAGQGMQTHRSYWVAYRHIVRLQRNDHRLMLHLTGGHEVPVSRSFREDVRNFMRNRDSAPAA